MTFQKIAELDGVWEGEKLGLVVDGRAILLVNIAGSFYAYEDRCRHQGVALSKGKLDGNTITCSAHHWQYDLVTGKGINPASICLRRYPVKVEGDAVLVDIDALEPI